MNVGPKEARLRAAREAPSSTEPAVPAKTKEKTMTKIDDTDNAPAPAGLADVPDLPTFLARPKPTKEERDALAAKAEREPRMPGAKIRSPRKRASAASKGLGASPSQLRAHGAKPGAKKKAAAKALDGLLAPARRAKGKRPERKGAAAAPALGKPGTIGAVAREAILAGLDNEAALAKVKKAFPEANTNAGNINWYRNDLRKRKLLPRPGKAARS